jgi:hypothetical protein
LLHLLPCLATGAGPAGKTLVRTRVEPKTFFANERTFLAWLQIAVLVMMTGLGLLSGSSMMVAGGASAGGVAANCMDSLVCSTARVSGIRSAFVCTGRCCLPLDGPASNVWAPVNSACVTLSKRA